jgi:hypothetical protein
MAHHLSGQTVSKATFLDIGISVLNVSDGLEAGIR